MADLVSILCTELPVYYVKQHDEWKLPHPVQFKYLNWSHILWTKWQTHLLLGYKQMRAVTYILSVLN